MMRSIAVISSQAFSLLNFRGPLLRTLAHRGLTVYALAPDFDEQTRARVASLGAQPVDYSLSRAGMNPLRDIADAVRLGRVLKRLAPEATLAYFIKPVIYGSIAAWIAGVPRRFSMIEGLGYVFMDDVLASQSLRRRLLRYAVSRFYKFALRLNRSVFFLNREDIDLFVSSKLVAERQAARIDGIGLDLEHYVPAPPVLAPVTFVLVGRMLREKGIYEFVEAARKVRRHHGQARFVLVGGTDCNPGSISESDLRSWVEEGLVEWPGQVDDVRLWIAQASVFVLPSYREGVPRSSQEAMAMERPVITTDAVGCRETVQDNVNGCLVPVRDSDALARAMIRFVDSPDLIARMGRESRRIAEKRFDVHVINNEVLKVLGI